MADPSSVRFCRPFYDGMGAPLVGATITLRNDAGTVTYYTLIEITGEDGLTGVYYCDVTVSRKYYIWVKVNNYSDAVCIGEWSPPFIPAPDIGDDI